MRVFIFCLLGICVAARAEIAIEIDLTAQRAWLLQDGQRVYQTPISSGRAGHSTPTGNFSVTEKDRDHRSSLYGRVVDATGRTIIRDASAGAVRPPGSRFVAAPMKFFMRFDGAHGLHAGPLPGYPASHGCVRLPAAKAELFFNIVEIGTPVRVFGKAPQRLAKKTEKKATPALVAMATPAPRKGWFPWLRRLAH